MSKVEKLPQRIKRTGAKIVGVLELRHGKMWNEILTSTESIDQLLFPTPILKPEESADTTLTSYIRKMFIGWDDHCCSLLTESCLSEDMEKALCGSLSLNDCSRPTKLFQHFAKSLQWDAVIRRWCAESKRDVRPIHEAFRRAMYHPPYIWKVDQPKGIQDVASLLLNWVEPSQPRSVAVRIMPGHQGGPRAIVYTNRDLNQGILDNASSLLKDKGIEFNANASLPWTTPENADEMIRILQQCINNA